MERENICMEMAATTMEIGSKEKWKDMVNYTTQMEIYNMKGNGKMIIIMEKVLYMGLMMLIGLNILDSLRQVKNRALDKCILKMEINIKDNLEAICLGEKVVCSLEMDR